MKKVYFVIIATAFILSLTGCDLLPTFKKSSKPKASTKVESSGPILAKINDWTLTVADFDRQIETLIKINEGDVNVPVQMMGILASTFIPVYIEKVDLSSADGKGLYLEFQMNMELLAQEAENRGLDKDPEVIRGIRRNTVEILDLSLLNRTLKDIKVTSAEVEEVYNNEYKRTLENTEQRKISEIVVSSKPKANDILVQLLTGGKFSNLASQHSIAETAAKGGDLGYLVPRPDIKFNKFWETAYTLDKGATSSVFKDDSKEEYYIIMVEDVKKGEPEPLDAMYSQIEILMIQQKSVESITELIRDIKLKADVVINSNLIN
ncbi:MAG: peptidylprolyl isomerase [Candidatus Omnitrophica bacterium]|nr:peptidylprolyl isomerase [Candidatus Omnitrophota bacterium]